MRIRSGILMSIEKNIKTTQEQAIASWNQYLGYMRLDKLSNDLAEQYRNYKNAIEQFNLLKSFILAPNHIMGNPNTKYGEIAEHVHVRLSNTDDLIIGKSPTHSLDVRRLSQEDYLRNGKMVQSKFYNSPMGTLRAIFNHLKKYPDFIKNDGEYDIPREQFEILKDVYYRGETNRFSLGKTSYGNEETLYNNLKKFENEQNVKFEKIIKPAKVEVKEVQLNTVHSTIRKEEKVLSEKQNKIIKQIEDNNAPKFEDFANATILSAVAEGATTFLFSFYKKKKERKEISEFTNEDWIQIFEESGISIIKGGIRGSALFTISNFSKTPAPIANAMITATFGMITQANLLSKGVIDNDEFIDNSELMCLDVSLSALSSMIGQAIIPIPVIGAILGNTIGMFMEQIALTHLNDIENKILNSYEKKIESKYKEKYLSEYNDLFVKLQIYENRKELIKLSFDSNSNNKLSATLLLADTYGIKKEELILADDDLDEFFNSTEVISLN